jgi:Tetracyclin repressor-like, C-terminal domain
VSVPKPKTPVPLGNRVRVVDLHVQATRWYWLAHPPIGHDLTTEGTPTVLPEVNAAFDHVIQIVRRAMTAGRIRHDDIAAVAGQIWSMIHGYVLLEIAGVFGNDGNGVSRILARHAINLLVGLGDQRQAAELSLLSISDPLSTPEPTTTETASRGVRRGRRPAAPGRP